MDTLHIQADAFFELIKIKEQSMWDVFAQMIDGKHKHLLFLNTEDVIIFDYILPKTLDEMLADKSVFSKSFADKIAEFRN